MKIYTSHHPLAGVFSGMFNTFVRSYVRIHAHGVDHLPRSGPFVIAANHTSHADTAVLFATIPRRIRRRLLAAAASDYFFDRKLRQFVARTLYNAVPVDRDSRGGTDPLRHVIRALREGYGVVIFPEGTRSVDGELGRFRAGIGRLAALFPEVPIIPTALIGTELVLPKGRSLPTPSQVEVLFGAPMFPKAAPAERATWQVAADQVREAVVTLVQQARQPTNTREPLVTADETPGTTPQEPSAASETLSSSVPLPPMVARLPLLGHTRVLQQNPLPWLVQHYRQLGPIFQVRWFGRQVTVLAGVEGNLFFERADGTLLRDPTSIMPTIDVWPVTLTDEQDELNTSYQPQAFRAAQQMTMGREAQVAAVVQQELAPHQAEPAVRLLPVLQRMFARQLSMVLIQGASTPAVQALREVLFTTFELLGNRSRMASMLLGPLLAQNRSQFRTLVERLATQSVDAEALPDLVAAVIKTTTTDPDLWNRDDLFLQVLRPYAEACEQASYATLLSIWNLLSHPHDLAQLSQIVSQPDGWLDDQQVSWARAALYESVRLYPATPWLRRVAAKDAYFAGCQIPAGTRVMIATTVSHFLPEWFPHPEEFVLNRFLPPRAEHRQRGAFAAFGLPAQTSRATGLAEWLSLITITELLGQYQLELVGPPLPPTAKRRPPLEAQLKVRLLPRSSAFTS